MVTYRPATSADADAIARLHAESWRATYRGLLADDYLDGPVWDDRLTVWRERLAAPSPSQYVVVAERDSDLAGFACAYVHDDPEFGSLLDNIHVRRELQGGGIADALVAHVVDACRALAPGCGLYLWVFSTNARARRFYERLGATDSGMERRRPAVGGELREIHRYVWPTLDTVRVTGGRSEGSTDDPRRA